jgi:SAM-dependent methyltransferase
MRRRSAVDEQTDAIINKPGPDAAVLSTNANNPYHRAAGFYEFSLSLPVIASIRRQESRAVLGLLSQYADPRHRVIEIGPGTGCYTLGLARMFREVVAVEDSSTMAAILRQKLLAADAPNVTVVNQDFLGLPAEEAFDVAVAIGVLDYVAEPEAFVAKMCATAGRAVIFTAPQRGLWGRCFVAANRLRGTNVYCYQQSTPSRWAPSWRCTIREVGLKTPLTKGLTLVAVLERP